MPKGKSKGRRRQRNLERARQEQDPSKKAEPRSMVIQRGSAKPATKNLKMDLRRLMRPLTATKLKDSGKNHLKDFVDICGPLGVTHMLVLSATENSHWLKMARVPQGPTISFRVTSHTLIKDIKNAYDNAEMYETSPLVVLTGFTSEKHEQLVTSMVQKMFPTINPGQMSVKESKRVLLLHNDKDNGIIRFRHYGITLRSSGLSKGARALTQQKLPTSMENMLDISEILTKGGYGSESEGEDLEFEEGPVRKKQKVKLREIGPRMDLELVKIEQGVCDGIVLYHKHVAKSLEEVAETQRIREKKAMLKAMRKKEQEENVKRKKEEKEKLKAKRQDPVAQANEAMEHFVDDDKEYYKKEVGEEPDDHFGANVAKSAPSSNRKFHKARQDKKSYQGLDSGIKGKPRAKGKRFQEGSSSARGAVGTNNFRQNRESFRNKGRSGDHKNTKRKHDGKHTPRPKKQKQGY